VRNPEPSNNRIRRRTLGAVARTLHSLHSDATFLATEAGLIEPQPHSEGASVPKPLVEVRARNAARAP
jgi:hypothetical protein